MDRMPVSVVGRTPSQQRAHLAREVVETLIFVALVFVIINVTVQSRKLTDNTMSPAFTSGQLTLVNRIAYMFGGPSRGEVILIADPDQPSQQVLRRVIGIPGDTITATATAIIVNGVALKERYIKVPIGTAQNSVIINKLKLQQNQYFVLEDNRTAADDSTNLPSDSRGFSAHIVPRSNIIGRAVLVFWPLHDFHWVATYSSTYNAVPNP